MIIIFVILIIFNVWTTCLGCDIFMASKCPAPPGHEGYSSNYTLYCGGIKGYIDCLNKKLKTCVRIQEFGPALETIKWNVKVLILEGQSHGCEDLNDRIKLPRIPRKKPTTTKPRKTTSLYTEKTIVYIDPNCHRNLADMYCERLDFSLMRYLFNNSIIEPPPIVYTDEVVCKKISKYTQCIQVNFKIRCQQTLGQTFNKLERLNGPCLQNTKNKFIRVMNSATNTTNNNLFTIIIIALIYFYHKYIT